jgi:hypothetical protein
MPPPNDYKIEQKKMNNAGVHGTWDTPRFQTSFLWKSLYTIQKRGVTR